LVSNSSAVDSGDGAFVGSGSGGRVGETEVGVLGCEGGGFGGGEVSRETFRGGLVDLLSEVEVERRVGGRGFGSGGGGSWDSLDPWVERLESFGSVESDSEVTGEGRAKGGGFGVGVDLEEEGRIERGRGEETWSA